MRQVLRAKGAKIQLKERKKEKEIYDTLCHLSRLCFTK